MTDEQSKAVLRLYGLTSLDEATWENWEWWDWTESARTGFHYDAVEPYMPDFPNDYGAAVKLAERMGSHLRLLSLSPAPDHRWENRWLAENVDGRKFKAPTLGEALLAALD